jgi:hypothetical protein
MNPILMKCQMHVIGYFGYGEVILVIYNQKKINIEETIDKTNKQRTNIKFTTEKEQHNSVNFLYLTIHRKRTKLEFTVYTQITYTNILTPNYSCHQHEHKISSINYIMNIVHTYPTTKEAKEK